jgi:hypothetical protein
MNLDRVVMHVSSTADQGVVGPGTRLPTAGFPPMDPQALGPISTMTVAGAFRQA